MSKDVKLIEIQNAETIKTILIAYKNNFLQVKRNGLFEINYYKYFDLFKELYTNFRLNYEYYINKYKCGTCLNYGQYFSCVLGMVLKEKDMVMYEKLKKDINSNGS